MATLIDKALSAAAKEWQAEQRYDKAEAEYRLAHRNFCVTLIALDAKQGKANTEFTEFCERYAEDVKQGKVKPRNVQKLRKMRAAGLLDVPQNIVVAVDPQKILVTAAKVLDTKNALTEKVAIDALSQAGDESSEAFGKALDNVAEQLEKLAPQEQVLPKPKTERRKLVVVRDADADAAAITAVADEIGQEDIDPADEALATAQNAAIHDALAQAREVLACEHPALKHLDRAIAALEKMPPVDSQFDALITAHMEVGMKLDRKDTVSDEDISNLLDAESDDK